MKYKKGAMVPEWVVIVIILLVSFVILLFIYYQINWNGTIDKDSCRESALLRATTPEIMNKKLIDLPLRCQTEKICIASSWYANLPIVGGCDEFRGEKNVKIVKVKTEDEIKQVLADAMYDCWWMFYFGDNNLFSRATGQETICSLCSRIAFDNGVKNKYSEITGLVDYMKKTMFPRSDKTYFQTIFGDMGSISMNGPDKSKINTSKQYVTNYYFIEAETFTKEAVTIGGTSLTVLAVEGLKMIPVVGWVINIGAGKALIAAGTYASLELGETIDKKKNGENGFAVGLDLKEYSVKDLEGCKTIATSP